MVSEGVLQQAISIGRQIGEPTGFVPPRANSWPGDWLLHDRRKNGLADPRLELLRALSATVSRSREVDPELITMVRKVGWTIRDLEILIPTYDWRAVPTLVEENAAE